MEWGHGVFVRLGVGESGIGIESGSAVFLRFRGLVQVPVKSVLMLSK